MLADSRHNPTEDDLQMLEFLHYHILPFTLVLTKADKLSKMKLKEHIRAIAADLYLTPNNMLATSSETGYGKTEVLNKLREIIDNANEPVYVDEEDEDDDDDNLDVL